MSLPTHLVMNDVERSEPREHRRPRDRKRSEQAKSLTLTRRAQRQAKAALRMETR